MSEPIPLPSLRTFCFTVLPAVIVTIDEVSYFKSCESICPATFLYCVSCETEIEVRQSHFIVLQNRFVWCE